MVSFKYIPLDHLKQSVRLLQLCQGDGAFVECHLFDALLHDPQGVISYEALSYTWGDTDKPYEIEVDGRPMPVTKNLYLALQHLRYTHQDRILWIDAICIDQNNDKERGHQVRQMTRIYEQAERVLIWLGQGTADTDLLFDHLTLVKQHATIYDRIKESPSEKEWLKLGDTGHPKAGGGFLYQHRSGLNHLLRHSWFNRVWIIQEVAKARSAQILCGNRSASASDFAMLHLILGIEPNTHCQSILDIMPGSSRKSSWWSQNRELYTLLLKFRKSQATDPRDAIFALLGISSSANNTTVLIPDYEKSVEEVIQDTIFFLFGFQDQDCCASSLPKWTMSEFLRNLETLQDGVFAWSAEHGEDSVIKLLLDSHRVYPGFEIRSYQNPFLSATKNGHEACVRLILEILLNTNQANINLRERDGKTPLLVAAEQGYEEIVKLLLNEPSILVDLKGNDSQTPLISAVRNMHERITKLLLDTKSVDVNSKDIDGKTSLLLATENGDTAMVKLLLSQNTIQVHTEFNRGWAPIWRAAQSGHDSIVELLQEWEARNPQKFDHTTASLRNKILNEVLRARKTGGTVAPDHQKHSLLVWAAMNGHNDLVQLLLETDVMHQDERHALLAWAMKSKCTTAVILLLKTEKIYFRPDYVNRVSSLFVWAYRDGHEELLDLLLNSNAVDLNYTCEEGTTLLYSATQAGNLGMIKLLTATGRVNLNSRNGVHQQTPLSIAIELGSIDVAKHLLGTGKCQVDVRDSSGWTPLSTAVQHGRVSIVRILLDEFIEKVDLHSRDMWGESPMVWAKKRKRKVIYRMLVEADEKKIASERRFGGSNAKIIGV